MWLRGRKDTDPGSDLSTTRRLAHTRSAPYAVLSSVAFFDHLVVEQLGQSNCHRTGENVTAMLCNFGLSVRCRTGASVSTLTPESFRACFGPLARRDRMPPMSQWSEST